MLAPAARWLVRSPNWIGDAVMAEPLVAALRAAWPAARIDVAGIPSVAGVWACVPAIDGFVPLDVPGWRAARYDAALLVPRSFSSAWLAWRAGIPVRIGYAGQGRSALLTRAVRFGGKHQPGVHDVEVHLGLTEALGIVPTRHEPRLAVPEAFVERRTEIVGACGLAGRGYAAVAPGAAFGGAKRYPTAAWAAVLDGLRVGHGLESVLLGSAGERPIALDLVRAAGEPPVDLVGRVKLEEALAVLAGARLLVTNDSGLMHAGAALGVPVVALFGPTDPGKTAPRDARARIVREPVACAPCFLRECPIDHRCMTRLAPARVLDAVGDVLAHAESC